MQCINCGSESAEFRVDGGTLCEECFHAEYFVCSDCEKTCIKEDNDSYTICNSCDENYVTCVRCSNRVHVDDETCVDEESYCSSCANDCTFCCNECGEVYHDDNGNCSNRGTVCDDCFQEFICCDRCGGYFHDNDINRAYDEEDEDEDGDYEYLCNNCHSDDDKTIHEHSYKPRALFKGDIGTDGIYMGIELEVDKGGCNADKGQRVLNVANESTENVYLKKDGSLNSGFEIVSHPMTLDYHLNTMPWDDVLTKLQGLGYTSHDAGTCGLHIHVGREQLGKSFEEQDLTIMNILYFIEHFWNELISFTRRTENTIRQWANRFNYSFSNLETKDKVAWSKNLLNAANNADRYVCLNLQNSRTIEFRIFRGTLNKVSFKATLQFTHLLVKFCRDNTFETVSEITWDNFMYSIIGKYDELDKYLEGRKLIFHDIIKIEDDLYSQEDRLSYEVSCTTFSQPFSIMDILGDTLASNGLNGDSLDGLFDSTVSGIDY
jgi:hypothetical protein